MTAQIRKYFYLLSGLVSAVVPILVSLNIASQTQSDQWLQLLAVVGGIIGATGAGTAAVVVHNQVKNAPEPPAPADQIINALPAVVQQVTHAQSELERVKQAAGDILGAIPVLGPLAQQAINSLPKI